jgi:tripartite-type tricarboxylate transporter receptor subunit TctC
MLLAALLLCSGPLPAQTYPTKPVRLVIPFPAGSSSNDIIGRAVAQRLSEALGQQVVVDNRAGAGGNIGSEAVAKASPDGYTLLLGINGPIAISPSIYPKLGYDSLRDLAPIALIAVVPYLIVVNPAVPANNIKELIALAKAKPGQVHFSSTGSGGTPHLCGELLKSMAGIDLVHVPYKGGAPAVIDTIGGQVQMYCTGVTSVVPHIKSGKLRAIGMATLQRSALMPDLATVNEQGVPGFDVSSWMGLMAPAKTPPAIIRRLYDETAKVLASADMKNFILGQGSEPALKDPEQFRAYIKAEIAKWAKVVKAANIKLD